MKYLWQFTHDDLDGGGCAVIAAQLFPVHRRSVKYCHYNGPKSIDTVLTTFLDNHQPQEGEEHVLLITDILPNADVCEAIDHRLSEFVKVAAYDHHDTTSWAKGKYPWVFHGEACGTRLFYESRDRLLAAQQAISLERNRALVGTTLPTLVAGRLPEMELLNEGRLQRQAPEIDGRLLINDGTAPAGSLVEVITDAHPYDVVGRLVAVTHAAKPRPSVVLPVRA